MLKVKVAILGSGNIGTDLLLKLLRSPLLEPAIVAGVDETSAGLRLARDKGVRTSARGIIDILAAEEIAIVFDASGARAHLSHAPLLEKAGKVAIDLTPAAVGPYVIPCINLQEHLDKPNVNLITCGAQATVPMVWAVSQTAKVRYVEIISTISSRSAGLGTRQNIDEFTQTTARALELLGGAEHGKAIIILNPAEPPITMSNTIFALVEEADAAAIRASVQSMVGKIQSYVPGYRLKHPPEVDGDKVTIQIQVEGAGDYLPRYAGNLDIMTSAAVAAGEAFARRPILQEGATR